MFNKYSNSYFSDCNYKNGDFILSNVKKADLKRYNINMSVKDFKAMCNKRGKYKVIRTGGVGSWRRTRVFNYNDYKGMNI